MANSPTNNVALIVHACDRYQFLYKGFLAFFFRYWDFDIRCNLYFATEEKEVHIEGFENIRSGKGEWADRLAFLLKEKIKEPYVLYFQEDMWLSKKTNAHFFNTIFEKAADNSWPQIKMHSSGVYKTRSTEMFIDGFNIAEIDNEHSGFLMSHQITLWKKEFLLGQLYKNEHPWRNERRGTKRLKKLDPHIFHVDYFSENGHPEINNNKDPVLRSEYWAVSINGTLNDAIERYIPLLKQGNADEQAYAVQLEHNYLHKLTHDGKPRPKKTDIFKRTKNWLQGKESI